MLRRVARLSIAAISSTLVLQFTVSTTIFSSASPATAGKVSSSISSVAAKLAYLQTRGKPRHQSVPALESAPMRSAVVPPSARPRSVSGNAFTSAAFGSAWTSVGPKPITNVGSYGNVSGRITSLAVDPTNSAIVYAGSAGGGVWKTSDGGTTWSPLTDTQATLAIGAVAVDPQAHLTVYAATGENDRCGDCGLSQGVLKSTDGGATWTLYGQSTFATADTQASAVVVNGARVLVGTSTGLYTSSDGGHSWTANSSLTGLSRTSTPRVDVIVPDYLHPGRYYAAVGERCLGNGFVAMSTDSGSTWSISYRMPTAVLRIGLAVASNGWIYGSEASCGDAQGNGYGQLVAIFKSTDGGVSWTVIPPSPALPNYFSNGGTQSQGFYDNVVAVDATDGNTVVFGGVTMLATKDGGATFTDIARPYAGGPVHPDFHAIAFTSHNTFYTGNDGGVWRTTDLGGTGQPTDWTNLNTSLGVTTFFSGTALDATHMIGGAQDDGTSGLVPGGPAAPAWKPLLNGDGTWTAMDPTPGSNVIYGAHAYGFIYKGLSTEAVIDPRQAGTSWVPAGPCWHQTDPACSEPSGFVAPFLMDPANAQHLWSATNRIYETTTGGTPAGSGGWTRTDQDLTTGTSIFSSGDWISSMSYKNGVLATASFGGAVYVQNGRPTPGMTGWVNATRNLPAATAATLGNDAWVTDIWLGTTNPSGVGNASDMWVTMSGNGIGHVWHSTAGPFGQGPWVDMSGSGSTGVGNLVVDSITVTPSAVFIGTDAGAMVCLECINNDPPNPFPPPLPAPVWYALGSGLPNAKVDALRVSQDGKFLTAWTHGRGAWTLPIEPSVSFDSTNLNFGEQSVAQASATQTLTLTNRGTAVLNVGSVTVTGTNAGDFQIVTQNCWHPMLTGRGCQVKVQFTPQAAGSRSASLSFADNAPGSPQVVSLSGTGISSAVALSPGSLAFGDVAVQTYGEGTLTVSSTGSGNLVFKGVTVTGPNGGDFIVTDRSTCPISGGSLQPGTGCTFVIFFIVSGAGPRSGTLNISDNAPDSPQLVSLTGRGVVPSMSISPSNATLGFPTTNYGDTSAEQTVTLTNNGPGNLNVPTIYMGNFSGNDSNDFVLSSNTCENHWIAPTGSCTIGLRFRPTDLGARSATLSIYDNATGNPHSIALSGAAQGAKVNAVATISFGERPVGTLVTTTITLKNTGNASLAGLSLSIGAYPGANTDDFSASGCASPVAVNGSCSITVGFTPHASGHRATFLSIAAPNTVGLPQYVTLEGTGLNLRSVIAAPANAARGAQAVPPSVASCGCPPKPGMSARPFAQADPRPNRPVPSVQLDEPELQPAQPVRLHRLLLL